MVERPVDDDHDLALFEDVGARAAVAIDNARLYHERSRIAAILQRSLRPDRRPDIPDVDLEAIFEPAGEGIEVGGDFYDLLPVDQRWLLLIGDVAGKGPGAAALTGQIRHTVRALAVSGCSAVGLLERVNQILYEADVEMPFATAQLLELRPGDRGSIEAVLTSAGHPPAVACTSDGFRAAGGGSILGMSAEANLAPTRFELSPDTVLGT